MRQDPQAGNKEDETDHNCASGHRTAAGWATSANTGKQPELGRSYSTASSIRRAPSRLQRQDTALSVRWGRISEVNYEVTAAFSRLLLQ
jgi:hypothetical protein